MCVTCATSGTACGSSFWLCGLLYCWRHEVRSHPQRKRFGDLFSSESGTLSVGLLQSLRVRSSVRQAKRRRPEEKKSKRITRVLRETLDGPFSVLSTASQNVQVSFPLWSLQLLESSGTGSWRSAIRRQLNALFWYPLISNPSKIIKFKFGNWV